MGVTCAKCGSVDVICYPNRSRLMMAIAALWYKMTGRWRSDVPLCPACCEIVNDGHDYEYERSERSYFCRHCGEPASQEWIADRASDRC